MLAYALLGLVVGAGINLAGDYLPRRQRLWQPPRCFHCDQPRRRRAWIGVLGYLLERGRCPHCTAPIPLRWPLVEVASALLFAFLWERYGFTLQLLLITFYSCIFLLILITDFEQRLILNSVIVPAIAIALLASLVHPNPSPGRAIIGGVIGFGVFYIIALVYPGGMGAGDVKLAAFIGLVTGFPNVVAALVIGIFAGGAAALILLLTRLRGRKSYIPYGPYLVLGGWLMLIWGQEIMAWYLRAPG